MTLVERVRQRVVPAVPVPFDADGRLDDELQRVYVDWMATQPIGGVAVWAHTGRGMHLSNEQRERVLEAWCGGLGDIPVIAGVGVPETAHLPTEPAARTEFVIREALSLTRTAAQGGAHGVLIHPPTALMGLADEEDRIVEFHQAVCSVGLPAIAFFLYQQAGGIHYSSPLVERILAVKGILGIKVASLDSVVTFQDLARTVAAVPDALLVTGEDRFLGYTISLGAQAALIGLGAACTDRSAALFEAWIEKDWSRYLAASAAIDAFAQATFVAPMEGYVQRMLWALEADGVLPREAFDPLDPPLPARDRERERVFAAVRALRAV
jgi:4-hydroxy-tetrahydrodipicolinate synthase